MSGIDVIIKKRQELKDIPNHVVTAAKIKANELHLCDNDDDVVKCPKDAKVIVIVREVSGDFGQLLEFWPRNKDVDVASIQFVKALAKSLDSPCLIGDDSGDPFKFKLVDQGGKTTVVKLKKAGLQKGQFLLDQAKPRKKKA